jgi:hypothetical protein
VAHLKNGKVGNNYKIEIQRSNVTLTKFYAHVRYQCKKLGIDLGFSDRKHFENFDGEYISYIEKDGKKHYTFSDGHGKLITQIIDEMPPAKAETIN